MAEPTAIQSALSGLRCTDVTGFSAESWKFDFEGKVVLQVYCPWRIITDKGIVLGNADHGQRFGLPAPIDAQHEARKLLSERVLKVTIREKTADLLIEFEKGSCLEVFNSSSGYEGWECSSKNGLLVIARGGGDYESWNVEPPLV
jgi:Family of unknown function (DUF6188)